jgi:hypothetical protein
MSQMEQSDGCCRRRQRESIRIIREIGGSEKLFQHTQGRWGKLSDTKFSVQFVSASAL